MKERLIHILDQSACISRRQMTEYTAGTMIREEAYALEQHLNTCPLCSAAIDGMLVQPEAAIEAMSTLNGDFLKTHFAAITPQIHLNSMAASVSTGASNNTHKGRRAFTPARLAATVAVLVALSLGATWYFTGRDTDKYKEHSLAVNTPPPAAPAPAEQAAVPAPATGKTSPAKTKAVTQPNAPKNKSTSVAASSLAAAETEPAKDEAAKPGISEPANRGGINIGGGRTSGTKYVVDGVTSRQPAPTTGNAAANQQSLSQSVAANSFKADENAAPGTVSSKKSVLLPAPAGTDKATASDNLKTGDELLKQSKYSSALTQYKKELNSADKGRRQKATVKAAQCYANTGNKAKARQLLQALINEGGPEKHTAKKLLKDLEKDEK